MCKTIRHCTNQDDIFCLIVIISAVRNPECRIESIEDVSKIIFNKIYVCVIYLYFTTLFSIPRCDSAETFLSILLRGLRDHREEKYTT